MRQLFRIGMARAATLGSLAVFGLLLAQGRFAGAQNAPSNAGDSPATTRNERPSINQGQSQQGNLDGVQGAMMLIAHGLEMTIEGSTLQGLAMRAGGMGGGSTGGLRPVTTGAIGTGVVTPGTGAAGTGFTGTPGETVSGRPAVIGDPEAPGSARPVTTGTVTTATPGTAAAGPGLVTDGPRSGTLPVRAGTPAPPMAVGQSAALLQQQARRSFEAGERLLGQVSLGGAPDQKLVQAANRYAATLRSLGGRPVAGGMVNGVDLASISAINHGVKEAIGSIKIKQLVRMTGSSNTPAAQQLLAHAQEMDADSRTTLQSFIGGVAAVPGATTGGVVGPSEFVQSLSQQANDLILAMQGLDAVTGGLGR